MCQVDRWSAVSEVIERFYDVERVGMVLFEVYSDEVYVYVVVYGDTDDEELRGELLRVEDGVVRDFSSLSFNFCYMTIDEVLGE